jgi:serine phosphatase RsbU (regulator of sigma subunit)
MVLGCFEEAVSDEPAQQLELGPCDRLIFYTDGLTEVFNHRREMLGPRAGEKAASGRHEADCAERGRGLAPQPSH